MNIIGPKISNIKTLDEYKSLLNEIINSAVSNGIQSNRLFQIINRSSMLEGSIILHSWRIDDSLEEVLQHGQIIKFLPFENRRGGGDYEILYRISTGVETVFIDPCSLAADFVKGYLTFISDEL